MGFIKLDFVLGFLNLNLLLNEAQSIQTLCKIQKLYLDIFASLKQCYLMEINS